MRPQSEIICSSPSHLCSNQKRQREKKKNILNQISTFFIIMFLGLDQVISIIALIHSRTKGAGVGILKTKCPPIPPPSISHSLVPVLVLSTLAPCHHSQQPLEKSPAGLGWPCSPFVSSHFYFSAQTSAPKSPASWAHCQSPSTGSLRRVSRSPGAQAGDTHQVSITPDRNVDT